MSDLTILRNSSLQILRANNRILRSKEGFYYSWEIDELIAQGWIPVATAEEFHSMQLSGSRTMGFGTIWQGTYTTGLTSDKKYIQLRNIDLLDYYTESNYVRINLLGKYDGNGLLIFNFISDTTQGGNALFNGDNCTERVLRNMKISGQFGTNIDYRVLGAILTNSNPAGCIIENILVVGKIFVGVAFNGGGGLCATNDGLIQNCKVSIQTLSTRPGTGGLVGTNNATGEIYNCHVNGSIIIEGSVQSHIGIGGIAGYNFGIISQSTFLGIVDGGRQTGGIVGQNSGLISKCYANGTFQARWSSSFPQCGGIAGANVSASGAIIEKSHSSGSVIYESTSSGSRQGGIAGANGTGCTITDSFSNCSVTSTRDMVGGAVGQNSGTIINCYATGLATGTTSVGGLVGNNTGTVTNSYYDKDTGGPTAGAGNARTTEQMQEGTASSFILPAGGTDPDSLAANAMYTSWDDVDTWDFGTTSEYPTLK